MATKGKTAAKAAPAPVAEVAGIQQGDYVKFLGYGPDVPAEEQHLTEGETYEVVGVTAPEGEDPGGNPILSVPNPDFNAAKKEDPAKNPRFHEIEAFPEEVELTDAPAAEGDAEAEAEAAPAAKTKPAAKTAAKAAAPAAKTPAKAAAGKTPAAKTPAAKTPAKGAGKGAAKAPEKEEVAAVEEEFPELENEDADVLAIVEAEGADLVTAVQELEAEVGSTEFRLGGILFHIRKNKVHLDQVDENDKPIAAYAEKGGFAAFIADYFNMDYRKAMYLIEIYVNFTLAGIENPAERVSRIGWTKASKIAKLVAAEGSNPEELLELAETSTVADLSTAISEQVTVGATTSGGEVKKRVTMKFRFFEEEGATNLSILETVKEQMSLKDIGEALSHVLGEWATQNGGGTATAESAPVQATKPVAKAATKRVAAKA